MYIIDTSVPVSLTAAPGARDVLLRLTGIVQGFVSDQVQTHLARPEPEPTPCTLRPTPYALHPAPCTLHPAPSTTTNKQWTQRCARISASLFSFFPFDANNKTADAEMREKVKRTFGIKQYKQSFPGLILPPIKVR